MLNLWNDKIGSYTQDEFLDNLYNDEFYYSKDHGGLALSASNLKPYYYTIAPKERKFLNTEALDFGNWLHKIVLEPDTYSLEEAPEADIGHLELLRDSINKDPTASSILTSTSLKTEIPYNKKLDGIWVKGKIDVELPGEIWDLKSTSSIDSYDYTSVNVFGYPLSAWMYWILTGKVQHYIVVEKGTGRVKIVRSDRKFYEEGRRAFNWAWKNYKKSLNYSWTYLGHTDLEIGHQIVNGIHLKTINSRIYGLLPKQ